LEVGHILFFLCCFPSGDQRAGYMRRERGKKWRDSERKWRERQKKAPEPPPLYDRGAGTSGLSWSELPVPPIGTCRFGAGGVAD
jgi:hypothetical protein